MSDHATEAITEAGEKRSSEQPKAVLHQWVRQRWHGEVIFEAEGSRVAVGERSRPHWRVTCTISGAKITPTNGSTLVPVPTRSFEAEGLGAKRAVEHAAAQVPCGWGRRWACWVH
jgi:dsRNA-specific ribonuclease